METAITILFALAEHKTPKIDWKPLAYVSGLDKPTKNPNEIGVASRFGDPGDNLAGTELFCNPGKKVDSTAHICAHRTLPCNTILFLENPRTNMRTFCIVKDRGPFGAVNTDGEWTIKVNKDDPGEWRGIIDMSPAVSSSLSHNGMEKINIWHYKIPAKKVASKS
jgi:hypothetical protein